MSLLKKKINFDLSIAIAFVVIVLPQLILKPFGGDLSVVDIGAPLVIIFCLFRERLFVPKTQSLLLLFIFFVVFIYFILLIFGSEKYIENSPYLIRMLSMYAPVFLTPYLSKNPNSFFKFGRVFVVLSLISTSIIIVLYTQGWGNFNAHQTIAESDGNVFNRLGGLPGESGAFAYNILFIFYMASIVFFVASKSWIIKVGSFILVMLVVFFSFKYSLARVIVICVAAVLGIGYLISNISFAKKYTIVIFFASCFIAWLSFSNVNIDFSQYRLANISGADANSLSSGRVSHWIDGVNLIIKNPEVLIFGIGHRMSVVFLGHAVENFFLQNILDYGIIGTLVFVFFLLSMLRPIVINAKLEGGVSVAVLVVFSGIFLQWQFNDINTYYQTYPATLFFLSWWSSICLSKNKILTLNLSQ